MKKMLEDVVGYLWWPVFVAYVAPGQVLLLAGLVCGAALAWWVLSGLH